MRRTSSLVAVLTVSAAPRVAVAIASAASDRVRHHETAPNTSATTHAAAGLNR